MTARAPGVGPPRGGAPEGMLGGRGGGPGVVGDGLAPPAVEVDVIVVRGAGHETRDAEPPGAGGDHDRGQGTGREGDAPARLGEGGEEPGAGHDAELEEDRDAVLE